MKILVLSNLYPPDFIGGYELCCRQIVDGLLGRGHNVRVLTAPPRVPCVSPGHVSRQLELVNCFDRHGLIHARPIPRELLYARAAFANAHNVHLLSEALADFQPDVVYLWHLYGLGGLGLLAALQYMGVPWLWCLEDSVPRKLCSLEHGEPPELTAAFSRFARGSYMAVSQRVVDEVEAAGIELRDEVEIMPNWILGERPPDRATFYQPGEHLRIVSSGYIGRHKGTHLLVEAAALLRDRGHQNFSIDLIGKLGEPAIHTLAQQLGVEPWVKFLGAWSQADLPRHYEQTRYDVFAFPTWEREPFGCAPMEAGAYGAAMVMTQSCGVGEWFVDGVHCLKTARTAAAFADTFEKILTGQIDLEPIARRGTDVIWRDFRIDALLPRIERALERAASRPCSPAGPSDEAYRLALLAEKLVAVLIQEW
ncbi:MAG TPA: glycosyltransferase family 4 protein [Pirellulales bacterium]